MAADSVAVTVPTLIECRLGLPSECRPRVVYSWQLRASHLGLFLGNLGLRDLPRTALGAAGSRCLALSRVVCCALHRLSESCNLPVTSRVAAVENIGHDLN